MSILSIAALSAGAVERSDLRLLSYLGETRDEIDLLEEIATCGSISAAGRKMVSASRVASARAWASRSVRGDWERVVMDITSLQEESYQIFQGQ